MSYSECHGFRSTKHTKLEEMHFNRLCIIFVSLLWKSRIAHMLAIRQQPYRS